MGSGSRKNVFNSRKKHYGLSFRLTLVGRQILQKLWRSLEPKTSAVLGHPLKCRENDLRLIRKLPENEIILQNV